jgi:N-acetylmuramoyl-L-alanine amidase
MAKKYIILDAGHASVTAGKRSADGSLLEWEFNNDMQYRLKKRLEQLGFTVYLVNPHPEKGSEVSLGTRCKLANDYWVKLGKPNCLYVSLHANAAGATSARGVEVFTSVNCSSKSTKAAEKVCSSIFKDVYAIDKGFKNRGVKKNNFYVVKHTNCPAILIEYAFYSNKQDLAILKNKRTLLCEATLKGICEHYGVAYKMAVDISKEKENEGKLPSTSKPWKNGTYNAKVKVIAKDGLNVRRGRPGSDKYNDKLGVLPEGAVVEVGYCLNGWFGVIYNGQQGFISGDYVKLV